MIYRYCPYDLVDAAIALGWLPVGPMPAHHGAYSMLLVWLCECTQVWPLRRVD